MRHLKRKGGGVVHVKMKKRMLVQFLGLKYEGGGGGWVCEITGHSSEQFSPTLQCNIQKLLRFHSEGNLKHGYNSTRCDGKICQQINCQNIIPGILLYNIFATLQKILHCQHKTCYTQTSVHATATQ